MRVATIARVNKLTRATPAFVVDLAPWGLWFRVLTPTQGFAALTGDGRGGDREVARNGAEDPADYARALAPPSPTGSEKLALV